MPLATSPDERTPTDDAFARIIGRQPTEQERARLYRVRDALGLKDDDAFWNVLLALEHYESLHRDYPGQIREQVGATIEDARKAFAAAAAAESTKAQQTLSEKVAETSVAIAKRLSERPIELNRVTALLALTVLFGAMCTCVGANLSGGTKAAWWAVGPSEAPLQRALALILGAPAGWMVFALMMPGAYALARAGWARRDPDAGLWDQVTGWTLILVATFGAISGAALLFKTVGAW